MEHNSNLYPRRTHHRAARIKRLSRIKESKISNQQSVINNQ